QCAHGAGVGAPADRQWVRRDGREYKWRGRGGVVWQRGRRLFRDGPGGSRGGRRGGGGGRRPGGRGGRGGRRGAARGGGWGCGGGNGVVVGSGGDGGAGGDHGGGGTGGVGGWLYGNSGAAGVGSLVNGTVPLHMNGPFPAVTISVNGGPSVPVTVDTGSNGLL